MNLEKIKKVIASYTIRFWWNWQKDFIIAHWYEDNKHFRYKKGDTLELIHRSSFGYGIRPVITITDTSVNDRGNDVYVGSCLSINPPEGFNFMTYLEDNKLPDVVSYNQGIQTHFKCNIEMHFKLLK